MAFLVQFTAFGQTHSDVWIGAPKRKIREVIMEIDPEAKIYNIQKINPRKHEELSKDRKARRARSVESSRMVGA